MKFTGQAVWMICVRESVEVRGYALREGENACAEVAGNYGYTGIRGKRRKVIAR